MSEIDNENQKKLKGMSRKELEEELADLRASLSPNLLEKLKQMGNPKKQ